MVERFNGRIEELLQQKRVKNLQELEKTIEKYCKLYSYHIPQKLLGHCTPIQVIKDLNETSPPPASGGVHYTDSKTEKAKVFKIL